MPVKSASFSFVLMAESTAAARAAGRIAAFIHGHPVAARADAMVESIAAIAAAQNTAAAAPRAVPLSIRRNASPDPSRIC
jgi:hypothetical protein